jgi:hypothetical protein
MFAKSLDPLLALLEEHRVRGSSVGIKFEARKLTAVAAQMGALKLSSACMDITRHFASDESRSAPWELDPLVDHAITETIRVQRKVRDLLTSRPHIANPGRIRKRRPIHDALVSRSQPS